MIEGAVSRGLTSGPAPSTSGEESQRCEKQKNLNFLARFPPEIRNTIYTFVFDEEPPRSLLIRGLRRQHPLTFVSTRIRMETLQLYYLTTRFEEEFDLGVGFPSEPPIEQALEHHFTATAHPPRVLYVVVLRCYNFTFWAMSAWANVFCHASMLKDKQVEISYKCTSNCYAPYVKTLMQGLEHLGRTLAAEGVSDGAVMQNRVWMLLRGDNNLARCYKILTGFDLASDYTGAIQVERLWAS
ncbi:hypothetical protein B0A49_10107 [Cryomyces minteri]|uniref:Uncharacterized protein n=1 Tax=Cryomyces minteri TaxID=331657 RepID=A0A4U0VS40_9PEZI|nr:hypothetical protein B0A49_10107 [Cryomyces minteri]